MRAQQTRLQRHTGEAVSTEERAEAFADFLEEMQWKVRHVTALPESSEHAQPQVDIVETDFPHKELRMAIGRMSPGQSVKENDIPIEIYKVMASADG